MTINDGTRQSDRRFWERRRAKEITATLNEGEG